MTSLTELQLGLLQNIISPEKTGTSKTIDELVKSTKNLSGRARVNILTRSFYLRLLHSMRAEYPILCKSFGSDLFDDFALKYLEHHPAKSYTLHELGAEFPRFLGRHRPDKYSNREAVFDFMLDLANLERTSCEVFRGEGVESLQTELLTTSENQRYRLSVCTRLLAVTFPLLGYFLAARQNKTPEFPEPQASYIIVSQQNFRCTFAELEDWQYQLLLNVQTGLNSKNEEKREASFLKLAVEKQWLQA